MDGYNFLLRKLESFIRRFYLNELIKGIILFGSIGLLYFLFTIFLEHFLWLDSGGRALLFWSFILVEILLLWKFILIPLLRLFKLSKGLDHSDASRIIGNHFPEVSDKLLNLLQLKNFSAQSELLLAGIEQKAGDLRPIPFASAVNFKVNFKYLKYAVVPLVIIAGMFISGDSDLFADSYTRVVNYKQAYEPPAPYFFKVLNSTLAVEENETFVLEVQTFGEMVPDQASIKFEGQSFFLESVSPGKFQFTFERVQEPIEFFLKAHEVVSGPFYLDLVEVPKLLDFKMVLNFPNYTGRKTEELNGSGNATIPEGTIVQWKLNTIATDEVQLLLPDTTFNFNRRARRFELERPAFKDVFYTITTSNEKVQDYERLDYRLEVIKDQYPSLDLQSERDSLDGRTLYFYGRVSDDYGIGRVELVYYPKGEVDDKSHIQIPITDGKLDEFFVSFPDYLKLDKGTDYELYFGVSDNDGLRNGKKINSRIFYYRESTEKELDEERLKQQEQAITGLDSSLEKMEFSENELEELRRIQREKGGMDYNDRKKFESFLQRQQQQNEMMKRFAGELQKTLEDKSGKGGEVMKKELRERLEKKEERLEENEKLLEELKEYSDRIQEEELSRKLEELSKRNQKEEKNLEQLLELTKRYYVSEKSAKIARNLEQLAVEQGMNVESGNDLDIEEQDSLISDFEGLKKELNELRKENEALEKPMGLGTDKELEKEISKEQRKASEELKKGNGGNAGKHQKRGSQAMKKLASKMKQEQQISSQAQLTEDAEMLRQILDNLLVFSFEQEGLLDEFQAMERNSPQFPGNLRRQNVLKNHFEHVDDSLYSLALRNPLISERITDRLTDIEFDLNSALNRFAQNEVPQGIASQQYVITGANDLAYFLSEVLGKMQDMMQSSGSGTGDGEVPIQLPDLIQKQGGLSERLEEGIKNKRGRTDNGGEQENEELFEIFQEQQKLRNNLKELMEKQGTGEKGASVEEDMKQLEEKLLEEGFDPEVLESMRMLEQKMLDLEDAKLEEGQKPERQSETNLQEFENTAKDQILKVKEYFNTTEILNRQSLPLRRIYQQKVKEYFERGDH